MKVKKRLIFSVIASVSMLFVFCFVSAEDKADKPKKEKKPVSLFEIKLDGKIIKKGANFFLKTKDEETKLPALEADSKLKMDDFIDKDVHVVGVGQIRSNMKKPDIPAKHTFTKISEITLVNVRGKEPVKPEK